MALHPDMFPQHLHSENNLCNQRTGHGSRMIYLTFAMGHRLFHHVLHVERNIYVEHTQSQISSHHTRSFLSSSIASSPMATICLLMSHFSSVPVAHSPPTKISLRSQAIFVNSISIPPPALPSTEVPVSLICPLFRMSLLTFSPCSLLIPPPISLFASLESSALFCGTLFDTIGVLYQLVDDGLRDGLGLFLCATTLEVVPQRHDRSRLRELGETLQWAIGRG